MLRFVLLLAFFSVNTAQAGVLEYTVEGLNAEALENVNAWLGEAPNTPQARSNFLFTAETRVDSALRALGYYSADISLAVTREEPVWTLAISVSPGEPVLISAMDIRLTGQASQDEAFQRLLAGNPLAVGDQLHHGYFQDFKRKLQALGQQRGYFDAVITTSHVAVEPRGRSAEVTLHYDSANRYDFGSVQFDREVIAARLVLPLLTFAQGDPYDQLKLQESQANLQRTGYFSTVILRPDLDAAGSASVPLELSVYPAKSHSFDLGAGFSTDTRERVSLIWRSPKLNHYGHSQETRLQYSKINPSGRVTYSIPMTHPLNDVLQLSVRWENNEYGDLDSYQKELGVRREKKRSGWLYSYHLRSLNESWSTQGLRETNDYVLPGLSLSRRDHAGLSVNPRSGFSQLYRLEVASKDAGSDVDLVRATVNLGYIASMGERHRVVSTMDLGAAFLADDDRTSLAPSLSFFAGGSQSIRGFGYQKIGNELIVADRSGADRTIIVGGDRLLTGSVEYQYQFTDSWRGALFLDGGDAFDEGGFEWNYAAGFGVHYITQVGAIRLELANPISEDDPSWRFHLQIGAEF